MIKCYNSLSWRLGTQLKNRESGAVGKDPTKAQNSALRWTKNSILCTMLLLFSFVSFGSNNPDLDTKIDNPKKVSTTAVVTTCANATVIAPESLPIISQSLVCGTTNDITSTNSTTCGSGSYKGGIESVYKFTPTTTGSYNIAYSGQTYVGIFVYAGCPTSGGTCTGNVTGSGNSKNLNVTLTTGVEYYIVFDTWPSPASPCTGTFSLTPPPVACAGTPNAGVASISSATGCSGSVTNLSATGLTIGTGITYKWQSSPDNSVWTDIAGATTANYVATTVTGLRYYKIVTTCSNGSSSNSSNAVSYTASACGSINVPATGSNTVSCGTNTLLYDNGGAAGQYVNNSSGFTVLENSGTSVITLSGSILGLETCCDGIKIYRGVGLGGTLVATLNTTGTITPIVSAPGEALTIQLYSDGSVIGDGIALQASYSGTCASCSGTPSNIIASAITQNEATISWTAATPAPANGYDIYYSTSNTAPTAGTSPIVENLTASPLNATELSPSSTYYLWVRSDCDTEASAWVSGGNFTTTQIPATLPYNQDFSGTNGFSFVNDTQTNIWVNGSAAGNPGNSIYISNDAGATNNYNIGSTSVVQAFRDIAIPSGTTTANFSFDWRADGESCCDYLRVWLVPTTFVPTAGTQIVAGTGRVQIGANLNIQSSWQTYNNATLDLSSFANTTMRLVFEWRNDGSIGTQSPAAVDNISLLIPTCAAPTTLVASAATATTASLSWTASSSSPTNGYDVYYSTINTAPNAGTTPTVENHTASPLNVTGLTSSSTYYWWVRSDCNGDTSPWVSGGSFVTLCDVQSTPTPVQNFSTYLPQCWSTATGALTASSTLAGTSFAWGAEPGMANTGTNPAVRINLYGGSVATPDNDWLISQQIDLGPTAGVKRLNFDYAVTSYSGTAAQPTLGSHQLRVVVSTDGGATWSSSNVIKTYTGAATYSNTGVTETILLNYSGVVKIGFLATTTSLSPDIDFHIDNVSVDSAPTDTPDYVNLQFPDAATILAGGSATVYARVYKGGLTDVTSGPAPGILAWIGISPEGADASSNPNTWTTWIPATFNTETDGGSNDEYQATIGSALTAGTYRYASRFQLNGGPYIYGGTPFNAWNGTDSNSGVLTVDANPTQCAILVAPANAATNVTKGSVILSWTAPVSGPTPTGYKVYFGTTSGALTLVSTTTNLTYTASAPAYSTSYYWKVIPTTAVGGDAISCTESSFTTEANPFAPYCSTIDYGTNNSNVEPITLVNFAGINNASANTLDIASIENFISITGNVAIENSYTMTLKGNTDGNFINYFTVFIDWNQDGDFLDSGETIAAGSITNSTGLDAIQAVTTITVPSTALAGSTRMRIKKLFNSASTDACTGGGYGQSEDYTLNVICIPSTTGSAIVSACNSYTWPANGETYTTSGIYTYVLGCNTATLELTITPQLSWYVDSDGDLYGSSDPASLIIACTSPGANYVSVGGDCNDDDDTINPGASEFCWNNIDDNCDGTLSEGCAPIVVNMDTPNGFMIPTMATHIRAFEYDYPGVKQYRFSITNNTTGITVEVIRPTKYVTIPAAISNFSTSYTVRASAVVNGELVPYAGNIIIVTTPGVATVKLQSIYCGATLNTFGQTISSTWGQNATSYTFRARLSSDTVAPTYYYTSALSSVYTSMNAFAGLTPQYGASYVISVSYTYVDIATGDTVSSGYGNECVVNMPGVPTIGLISPMCGSTLTTKGQTIVAAHTVGALAYQLKVRLTDGSVYYENTPSASPYSNLMSFSGLTIADGTSYAISARVQVMVGGVATWSAYGAECVLMTAPTQAPVLRTIIVPFTALAYPNPFADSFLLDVKSSNTSNVDITVYDMLGRLVEQRQANVNELETTTIGNNYPSGVYNVIVTQDGETKAVRVVKR